MFLRLHDCAKHRNGSSSVPQLATSVTFAGYPTIHYDPSLFVNIKTTPPGSPEFLEDDSQGSPSATTTTIITIRRRQRRKLALFHRIGLSPVYPRYKRGMSKQAVAMMLLNKPQTTLPFSFCSSSSSSPNAPSPVTVGNHKKQQLLRLRRPDGAIFNDPEDGTVFKRPYAPIECWRKEHGRWRRRRILPRDPQL